MAPETQEEDTLTFSQYGPGHGFTFKIFTI